MCGVECMWDGLFEMECVRWIECVAWSVWDGVCGMEWV